MHESSDIYFASYGDLQVHRLMLQDGPRVSAYRQAILRNADRLRGQVAMDLGCGTGVLSVLLAKEGQCRLVYAVEANSTMAEITADLAVANGVDDRIAVVNKRIEDVDATFLAQCETVRRQRIRGGSPFTVGGSSSGPKRHRRSRKQKSGNGKHATRTEEGSLGHPASTSHTRTGCVTTCGPEIIGQPSADMKVDVLVSEWMGFYLVHESMLSSVLYARDRFLRPRTGLILPHLACLKIAAVSLPRIYYDKIGWALPVNTLPSSDDRDCAKTGSRSEQADYLSNVRLKSENGNEQVYEHLRGLDLSPLVQRLTEYEQRQPLVEQLPADAARFSSVARIWELDLHSATEAELESHHVGVPIKILPSKDDSEDHSRASLHGFGLWFEVAFETVAKDCASVDCKTDETQARGFSVNPMGVVLATGPADPPTHWKQSTVLLGDAMPLPPVPVRVLVDVDFLRAGRSYEVSVSVVDVVAC